MSQDIVTPIAEATDKNLAASQARHQTEEADLPLASSERTWVIAGRLGVLVAGLIAWQLIAGNLISTFYLPKPTAVLQDLIDWVKDGSLIVNILATLIPAIQGFLIAAVSAIFLGYVLAMARSGSKIFEPFIAAFYGIPIIALVPLMILWFGIGDELSVAVAAIASFFLMFYNVYFGIRDVSQALIDQVMIAGGSKWDIAIRVRLPSALVWVVAGTKVAVPHSVVGVVVAEFLTGQQGLGFLLSYHANQFDAAGTFAAVVMLAAISFSLDRLMYALTKRALMWKEATVRH